MKPPAGNPELNKSRSKSSIAASLAALGSVAVASSCCLPLMPFVFAAGAAGASTILERFRPYLIIFAILSLAFGFYQSWHARQCDAKPSRVSTFLLWFSAVTVIVFVFFPQVVANLLADLLAGRS